MFVMPVSGFIYVMAGGYGVNLFGVWEMPNLIGRWPSLATAAKWTHIVSAYVLVADAGGARRAGAVAHAGAARRPHLAHAAAQERREPYSLPRIETSLPS